MEIIEINDFDEFLALKEKWSEVLQKCNHTIFSTWEWLSTGWKYFGKGKKLMLLLAKENDGIIGIAPLKYSVYTLFGLRMGRIEFIGAPFSDYNEFIIAKSHNECISAFIKHLNKIPEKWACIDLLDIPECAKYFPFLTKSSRMLKRVHKCPFIPLSLSYESFLQRFNSNRRRYFRKKLNSMSSDFVVEFVDYSSPDRCVEGMEILFDLHQRRWRSRGFSGVFADSVSRGFNLDVARVFARRGWLGLYVLRLSGEPAAVEYGFKYNSKYCAYLNGFNPGYAHYSVGNMLRLLVIRKFIQEGLTEFDFLRGAEEYKDQWNAVPRWNYQAVLPRDGRLASLQHWLCEQYWRQGIRLKCILKRR